MHAANKFPLSLRGIQKATVLLSSVAVPACLSRIQGQKDFRSWIRIRTKKFKYFLSQNIASKLGNMIRDVHPGSGPCFFLPIPDPGFRGQKGTGSESAKLIFSILYSLFENGQCTKSLYTKRLGHLHVVWAPACICCLFLVTVIFVSVAGPDLGSVVFFLWDPGWRKKSGMNILDLIFEKLVSVFRVKNT
jgi:hypothetical protein